MKKLLIATPLYPPDIGGPATYAKLLVEQLPSYGVEVRVLSFGEVRHWPRIIRHILYFCRVCWLLRGVQVVLAQDTVSVGLPTMLAAKLLGKAFFVRVPGDYAWEQAVQRFGVADTIDQFQSKKYGWRVELLRWVQNYVVDNAQVVITPSLYFKGIVSGWGKKSTQVVPIYNGIELPPLGLPLAKREKFFITAGRLVPWKGFDELMQLMPSFPDFRLLIVGNGPDQQKLTDLIAKLNLTNQITLLGRVSREEMWKLLGQASVFVLNTSFESFSFQVVEAMAAGAPVVTTNIGSLPELIEDGTTGYLVTPNDREAIARSIRKVLENPEVTSTMVEKALIRSRLFGVESTIKKLITILNNYGNEIVNDLN